jgi:hypothetical protein
MARARMAPTRRRPSEHLGDRIGSESVAGGVPVHVPSPVVALFETVAQREEVDAVSDARQLQPAVRDLEATSPPSIRSRAPGDRTTVVMGIVMTVSDAVRAAVQMADAAPMRWSAAA